MFTRDCNAPVNEHGFKCKSFHHGPSCKHSAASGAPMAPFQHQVRPSIYRDCYYKVTTVVRPSYLTMGFLYLERRSLYWEGHQIELCVMKSKYHPSIDSFHIVHCVFHICSRNLQTDCKCHQRVIAIKWTGTGTCNQNTNISRISLEYREFAHNSP